jgi:hypothetical protein
MKLCVTCKIKKKNSEFAKMSAAKDKLQSNCKSCVQIYGKERRSTKKGFLKKALNSAKTRSRNKQVPFDLDIEYLHSIATDECPVFNVNLIYASSQKGTGHPDTHGAALDRVIPELGYVKGNVVFISNWANSIKSNATEIQLYAIADWLHYKRKEVLNAFKEQLAPVPERPNIKSRYYTQPRAIPTTGFGENYDHTYNHSRTVRGEDLDHRAQASSGDSVGRGGKEVVSSQASFCFEDHGQPDAEIVRLDFGRRYLSD